MSRVENILKGIAKSDRVAGAYLFLGPPGPEKKEAAEFFTGVLGCPKQDVVSVAPSGATFKIDQVRELQEWTKYGPSAGKYLIAIVDQADALTDQAAAAFLKTLEEPAPGVVFVLLADREDKIPATILSRCQKITLAAGVAAADEPWRAVLLDWLRAGPASDGLQTAARAGRLEQILDAERKRVAEVEGEAAKAEGAEKEVAAARVGARYRAVRATLLKELLLWHRDILMRVLQVETGGFHFSAEAEAQQRQAVGLAPAAALADVRRLEKLIQRLEQFPEASEAALLVAGLPQHVALPRG